MRGSTAPEASNAQLQVRSVYQSTDPRLLTMLAPGTCLCGNHTAATTHIVRLPEGIARSCASAGVSTAFLVGS